MPELNEHASARETSPERKSTRDYSIVVLDRTLDVLELLGDSPDPLGATEIARRLGATKSATWRILVNLEARGYLSRDQDTARYAIGPKVIELGLRAGSRASLIRASRSQLEWLRLRHGETANLGILDGDEVLYVDIVESSHDLRMAARPGARDTVHSTALGKAMLAFLPEDEREAVLRQPLRQKTTRTITDIDHLRRELESTRQRGISVEYGENEVAACCIGVPIFGPAGHVVGAISLAGPEERMTRAGVEEIRSSLIQASRTVTRELGGTWPALPRHDDEGETT